MGQLNLLLCFAVIHASFPGFIILNFHLGARTSDLDWQEAAGGAVAGYGQLPDALGLHPCLNKDVVDDTDVLVDGLLRLDDGKVRVDPDPTLNEGVTTDQHITNGCGFKPAQ